MLALFVFFTVALIVKGALLSLRMKLMEDVRKGTESFLPLIEGERAIETSVESPSEEKSKRQFPTFSFWGFKMPISKVT